MKRIILIYSNFVNYNNIMVFPIKKIKIKLKQFVSPKNIALRL